MKHTIKVLICGGLLLSLFACDAKQENVTSINANVDQQTVKLKKMDSKQNVNLRAWHTGTVKFFSFEGGFFGIITDKGQQLLPLNLDKKYLQEGAQISVYGYFDDKVMTIQMWGKPFRVEQVKLIKKGKPGNPVNQRDL